MALDAETQAVVTAAIEADAAVEPAEDKPSEPNEARAEAAIRRLLDDWLLIGLVRAGAERFVRRALADERPELERLRTWILLRLQRKVWASPSEWMAPNPDNFPLRANPVWPKDAFEWLGELRASAEEIRSELLEARGDQKPTGFQPYLDPKQDGTGGGEPGTDRGQWNVLYLFLNHKKFPEACEKFPKTVAAIERVFPRHYSHAFFSALAPGSHILPHFGPSNKMLRCHLPLIGLDGARLHVADQVVEYTFGEPVVWDHAFRHEAFHEGSETRVVLIVDFWHPDFSDEEVRFLGTLRSAKLRVGRQLAAAQREQAGLDGATNHFDIIDAAKGLLTDDDWWIIKAEEDKNTPPH